MPSLPQRRTQVFVRDNYTCRYCGLEMKDLYFSWLERKIKRRQAKITVDHVIPLSIFHKLGLKGIISPWNVNNLKTACDDCNLKRANNVKDEEIAEVFTLVKNQRLFT